MPAVVNHLQLRSVAATTDLRSLARLILPGRWTEQKVPSCNPWLQTNTRVMDYTTVQ